MKLVLHIGTHKTGTTALQRHLRANLPSLVDVGIHYAAPDRTIMANPIADALGAGRAHVAHDFFNLHVETAERIGAHTVLVSAENFYGMTIVSALTQRRRCTDVIEQERFLVRQLEQLLPSSIDDHKIVCYFRRPDHFAESWYNQHVKGSSLFDGTFHEFLRIIYPALLYNSWLCVWSEVFGQDKCTVRIYEECGADVVSDFCASVLEIDVGGFVRETSPSNERLSRELVEFKREKNATTLQSEKAREYRIFDLLQKRLAATTRSEHRDYQDFLSPQERADLLNRLESEMTVLQSAYDLVPFPEFHLEATLGEWTAYPGLSKGRRNEIEREYWKIRKSWRLRLGGLVKGYERNRGPETARLDAKAPNVVGLRVDEFGRRATE